MIVPHQPIYPIAASVISILLFVASVYLDNPEVGLIAGAGSGVLIFLACIPVLKRNQRNAKVVYRNIFIFGILLVLSVYTYIYKVSASSSYTIETNFLSAGAAVLSLLSFVYCIRLACRVH